MTEAANEILGAFDALPPDDRREVAAALLRRVLDEAPGDISDDALVVAAEGLFLELDADEARDGKSQSQ
jgi:hypothetical protein